MIRILIAAIMAASPIVADACNHLPPVQFRQTPTVPIDIVEAPPQYIVSWCHKDPKMTAILLGCTYQADITPDHHGVIVLNAALSEADRDCVLTYEKAHLPPNNWHDPVVEATAPDDPSKV